MGTLVFRNLTKDEIEVRVGGGKSLLLYKTARVDANILDETVGAYNWQKRFYQVKQTMICEIGIYDEDKKEWIWKADGGDDDYTMEKVKAECSDSMKRAGFQWGIGRSLYTAPKIKIPDQFKDSQFFDVALIEYDKNNVISKLVITTNFGKDIVFTYPKNLNVAQTSQNEPKGSISKEDLDYINKYLEVLPSEEARKKLFNWIDKHFHTMNLESLTLSQGKQVVATLSGEK